LFLKMAKEADKEKDFPKLPLEQVNDNEWKKIRRRSIFYAASAYWLYR
jgi:hypothetical protein